MKLRFNLGVKNTHRCSGVLAARPLGLANSKVWIMIIGAYATAGCGPDHPDFSRFLAGLVRDSRVTGLEMPTDHLMSTSIADDIFSRVPAHWEFALTGFPRTMLNLVDDPHVGLASRQEAGRAKAIESLAVIRAAVSTVNTSSAASPRISDIFLHSAPSGGSAQELRASLEEIASWDWRGCRLSIEHCDAMVDGHPAQKGFLKLEDELQAITECSGDVGVTINWARSAIEARSTQGPPGHLSQAAAAGALAWLMFSGVAEVDTAFGPAWADAHLPVDAIEGNSLLTQEQARLALQQVTPDTKLGLKVGLRPNSLTVPQRLQQVSACLDLLDRARSAAS